jgi:hypothetical protein
VAAKACGKKIGPNSRSFGHRTGLHLHRPPSETKLILKLPAEADTSSSVAQLAPQVQVIHELLVRGQRRLSMANTSSAS